MKPFWLLVAVALLAAAWRWRGLGRTGRVLAATAAVVAGLVGAGIVTLPSAEKIVSGVGNSLGDWTYLLVGVSAFLETGAFLGFIAPGETMVLFGGVLAGNGTIELVPLIGLVWACCMAGDLASYAIGRRYGRDFLLRYGAKVKVGEPQIEFVEGFFRRHGTLTLVVGRWIGVVRPLVPFLAGSTRLPFARFFAIDIVSTFLWSTAFCLLGSVFWKNFDQLTQLVSRFLFILATIVVVSSALAVAVNARRSGTRGPAIDQWIETLAQEHPVTARPASALWTAVGRVEPHLPGSAARREKAAESDTVPDNVPAPAGERAPTHLPDLDR